MTREGTVGPRRDYRRQSPITPDGSSHPHAPFPSSGAYLAIALAFVAFAIYGSVLPFEWRSRPLESAWEEIRRAILVFPTGRISRSDVLANTLLFVPVGFSLAAARLVDRTGWAALIRSTLIILPTSFIVSCTAEFLQMFASDRVPSGLDIAAQEVGCLLGIIVWAAAGQQVTDWARETLSAAQQHRLSRLLIAVAAAWMFVNLAPFDITVDLGDLAARVRTKRITLVPFGQDLSWPRRVWDVVAETVSAAPLGLLGVTAMQVRRRPVWPGAFLFGTAIVVLVECLQVFIKSHSADTADAILGSSGVAAGVWIGGRTLRETDLAPSLSRSGTLSARAAAVVGLWCLLLCAYHWLPYDFSVDNDAISRKLARMSLLPFAGYLGGSYLSALNDVLTKLALAVPLGLSAAFVRPRREMAFVATIVLWVLGAGCFFGAIEAGQLFLPTRTPDPTDVFVGVLGTLAGLSLGRWLQTGTHPSNG